MYYLCIEIETKKFSDYCPLNLSYYEKILWFLPSNAKLYRAFVCGLLHSPASGKLFQLLTNRNLFQSSSLKICSISARPFPSGAGSLRRYVRVLRDVCKSRIFLHAAPSSLPIIACLRVCGIACAIRMVSKASYNRWVLLRSAKKSAQKLAYMQFL